MYWTTLARTIEAVIEGGKTVSQRDVVDQIAAEHPGVARESLIRAVSAYWEFMQAAELVETPEDLLRQAKELEQLAAMLERPS